MNQLVQFSRSAVLLACTLLGSLVIRSETRPAPNTSGSWSLLPIKRPALLSLRDERWPRNAIDHFILARLEQTGLKPSPEADRATLIRRLSFDLTGLPPTPRELDAFVQSKSPKAYEELVEQLLASPQYGERWGRHWLDVARYTETQGFEYHHMRENAWHYRDYVIKSFNADKPYDRFMREQIAGDVLDPVTTDGIVATSLLVCGAWDQAGNSQANVAQRMTTREEEMEDMLSVIGQTFLGLTLNCARCHSHKFDPIPQEDYYRIKAVFDGVRHGETVIATPSAVKAHEARVSGVKEQITKLETEVANLESDARARVLASRRGTNETGTDASAASATDRPRPTSRWRFEGDALDDLGGLHGKLRGGASIAGGRLHLNGLDAFVETGPLSKQLQAKTLEAWLTLDRLDQRGGGVVTVEALDGVPFDSIVFAEQKPGRWMAGSESFQRTKELQATDESAAAGELVHLAIVYANDNSIAVYRNGQPYGSRYTPAQPLQTFQAGRGHVLFGKRHTGGGKPFLSGEIEEASVYDRALTPEEISSSFTNAPYHVTVQQMISALSEEQRNNREQLLRELGAKREELKSIPPLPVSYAGVRKQPEPTHRLKRGDVRTPEEVVTPGALSAVTEPGNDLGLSADAPEAERRRRFADWLADPRNPLPARVMANRVWHYHFGSGLVSTPNDFGVSGAKPSHPELLDWLASEFMASGWSVKALHRFIVTSATYRQASEFNAAAANVDADNQLLWRFSPHRLEAEALRDAMLAVSGQLNYVMGGPSFRPFETKSFNATFYFPTDKAGPEFNRRTVYRMNVNSGKDPMLEAFDCPDPSVKAPRRGMTTTPLQALSLMNNSFVQRQAKRLAERALAESHGDVRSAIQEAYRYCLARLPSAEELKDAEALALSTAPDNVCWALLNSTEFLYVR